MSWLTLRLFKGQKEWSCKLCGSVKLLSTSRIPFAKENFIEQHSVFFQFMRNSGLALPVNVSDSLINAIHSPFLFRRAGILCSYAPMRIIQLAPSVLAIPWRDIICQLIGPYSNEEPATWSDLSLTASSSHLVWLVLGSQLQQALTSSLWPRIRSFKVFIAFLLYWHFTVYFLLTRHFFPLLVTYIFVFFCF